MIARRIAAALLVAGLAAAGLVSLSCQASSPAGGTVHVVKFDGATSVRNVSLSPILWTTGEPGKRPAYAAVREGDVLMLSELGDNKGFVLRYRAADGDTLAVSCDTGRGLLGGKAVSVYLKQEAAWDWLARAAPADLKAIRLLWLDSELGGERLKVLETVAKVNPDIDLMLKGPDEKTPAAALAQAAALFRPRFLGTSLEVLKDPKPLLPALRGVEVLWLGEEKDVGLDFLKEMPHLERLQLPKGILGKTALPADLKNLRALEVQDDTLTDLSAVAPLAGLEELSILGKDVTDIYAVAKLPHLRVLSLEGCPKLADLAPLKDLPLAWLALPPETTQGQFNAIIADHPALVGVEVVAVGKETFKNLKDIGALKNLRGLKYLVLPAFEGGPDAAADLQMMKQMKGLRLLVLPPGIDDPKNAAELQELQKALPHTVITEGVGICLGSGWLLVLLPVVAAAAALAALRGAGGARHRPRDGRTCTRPRAGPGVGGCRPGRRGGPGGLRPAGPQRRGVAGGRDRRPGPCRRRHGRIGHKGRPAAGPFCPSPGPPPRRRVRSGESCPGRGPGGSLPLALGLDSPAARPHRLCIHCGLDRRNGGTHLPRLRPGPHGKAGWGRGDSGRGRAPRRLQDRPLRPAAGGHRDRPRLYRRVDDGGRHCLRDPAATLGQRPRPAGGARHL